MTTNQKPLVNPDARYRMEISRTVETFEHISIEHQLPRTVKTFEHISIEYQLRETADRTIEVTATSSDGHTFVEQAAFCRLMAGDYGWAKYLSVPCLGCGARGTIRELYSESSLPGECSECADAFFLPCGGHPDDTCDCTECAAAEQKANA